MLEKKNFIEHKAVGTTYLYRPLVPKKEYLKGFLAGVVSKYFDGSVPRMAAFFAKENDLDLSQLHSLMGDIEQEISEDNSDE